jgi:hypothetical protein
MSRLFWELLLITEGNGKKESEAEKLENHASIIKAKYSHQDSEAQNSG